MLRRLLGGSPQRSPSIYEHIKAHAPLDRPGLDDAGQTLPDEDSQQGPIRFAPGAMDGIMIAHASPEANQRDLELTLRMVIEASRQPDRPGLVGQFDDSLKKIDFISMVDPLIDRVRQAGPSTQGVETIGRRLATEGSRRNSVKVGISLLGLISGGDHGEILMTLGRHEEFTVYSAVALAATSADPERALWDLARLVDGWGRIHTVERLRNTRRPEIKEWILRKGFRNRIMDEYLAHIAATTGGLLGELEKPVLDPEMLSAACDIISALVAGGPAEGVDEYDDAPRAIELLLDHLARREAALTDFGVLDRLEGFFVGHDMRPMQGRLGLSDSDIERMNEDRRAAWDRRLARGWTPELRNRLVTLVRDIKARPEWRELAIAGLKSPDDDVFYLADAAARALGMDVLDVHLDRLRTFPDKHNWYAVMRSVDERRIDEVLDLAQRTIALDQIATGPGTEYGLGAGFEQHSDLDFVVQDLKMYPGKGWPLIAAALRSPVIRNRNMALNALNEWDRAMWPPEAMGALAEAAVAEPVPDVGSRMQKLLRGERFSDSDFEIPDAVGGQ